MWSSRLINYPWKWHHIILLVIRKEIIIWYFIPSKIYSYCFFYLTLGLPHFRLNPHPKNWHLTLETRMHLWKECDKEFTSPSCEPLMGQMDAFYQIGTCFLPSYLVNESRELTFCVVCSRPASNGSRQCCFFWHFFLFVCVCPFCLCMSFWGRLQNSHKHCKIFGCFRNRIELKHVHRRKRIS